MDDSTPATMPPPPEMRRLPRSWTAELQRRLLVIFGDRLGNALTDAQSCEEWIEVWSETLAWVTAEQIRDALRVVEARVKAAAREGRTEWPLSAVEFLALCESRTLPAHRPFPKALLLPRMRSAQQQECMARIREILGSHK